MDVPFGIGIGIGFTTTAPLAAAVCATLVGYRGWSNPRAGRCTPALGTAGLR